MNIEVLRLNRKSFSLTQETRELLVLETLGEVAVLQEQVTKLSDLLQVAHRESKAQSAELVRWHGLLGEKIVELHSLNFAEIAAEEMTQHVAVYLQAMNREINLLVEREVQQLVKRNEIKKRWFADSQAFIYVCAVVFLGSVVGNLGWGFLLFFYGQA